MSRRARALALCLCVCFLGVASPAEAETVEMLVVYEQGGDEGIRAQLASLRDMLLYMTKNVRYLRAEEVTQEDVEAASFVLVLMDESSRLGPAALAALETTENPVMVVGPGAISQLADTDLIDDGSVRVSYDFSPETSFDKLIRTNRMHVLSYCDSQMGGRIETRSGSFPLCAIQGNIAHFAVFDGDDPSLQAALATELTRWMWPYENDPHAYAGYVVLNEVYPFDDVEHLMEITDMLEKEGVPYAVTVMPVYDNAHFPSMKRFCEYLRYIQSRGATIILRTPLVQLDEVDGEELYQRILLSYEAYTQHGVYPLALQAPKSYAYLEQGISLLQSFRTVLLFESDDRIDVSLDAATAIYKDGHQLIAPYYGTLSASAFSTAIYLDSRDSAEHLQAQVRALRMGSVELRSLRSMEHSIYLGKHYVTYTPGEGLASDGQADNLQFTPFEYDEEFDYERGFIANMTEQIARSNQLILFLVIGATGVFLVCIWLARRLVRRQFLYRPSEKNRSNLPDIDGNDEVMP